MAKIYPIKRETSSHKIVYGELVHKVIETFLRFNEETDISDLAEEWEEFNKIKINYGKDKVDEVNERYQEMIDSFINSKFALSIGKRIVDVERAFMVEVGGIWVAGTMDLVIKGKGKGNLVIIDWKTGATVPSQFELDHGYQTVMYCHALEFGEFFLKPEYLGNNENYYESYKQTKQKNRYKKAPQQFIYAYLKEFIPAKRNSERQCRHRSTESMANENGVIKIEKDQNPGPIFYHANPGGKDLDRLIYSLRVAQIYAKNMVFPESISSKCERCLYQQKCLDIGGFDHGEQEDIWETMQELGIEPE